MKAGTEGVHQGLLLTELLLQSDENVQDINALLVNCELLLQLMTSHERDAIKATPGDPVSGLVRRRPWSRWDRSCMHESPALVYLSSTACSSSATAWCCTARHITKATSSSPGILVPTGGRHQGLPEARQGQPTLRAVPENRGRLAPPQAAAPGPGCVSLHHAHSALVPGCPAAHRLEAHPAPAAGQQAEQQRPGLSGCPVPAHAH